MKLIEKRPDSSEYDRTRQEPECSSDIHGYRDLPTRDIWKVLVFEDKAENSRRREVDRKLSESILERINLLVIRAVISPRGQELRVVDVVELFLLNS